MGQRGVAAGAGQGDPTGVPCNGGDRVAFWGRVLPGYRVLSKAGAGEGESLPAARPIDRTIILQRERERDRPLYQIAARAPTKEESKRTGKE